MTQTTLTPGALLAPPLDRPLGEAQSSAVYSDERRFPRQGEWTYADWLGFPNDGWKYEIINGVLYMSPPPFILHQLISVRLSSFLHKHVDQHKLGVVLTAPYGVRLPGQAVPVEPDILFVKRERLAIVGERYVEGAPDLIVEILSPSNAAYDTETKLKLYEQAGVAEYWVVNTWEKHIIVYHLRGSAYHQDGLFKPDVQLTSKQVTGFALVVSTLFVS
jgi:Uma2 family endonuclease